MTNTPKKPHVNDDDMIEAGRTGPDKKNEDKAGGSQSDNRGSGSGGKGKSSGSNRSSN